MPSNLSPYQLAIQAAVGKGKGAASRLTPDLLGRIADSTFGPAPVTPGSQILYQDATTVRWRDPQGFEHVATRDLNGTNPNAGQWNVETSRPAVLPVETPQALNQDFDAIRGIATQLQQSPSLVPLSPETAAQLEAIAAAERAQADEAIRQQEGRLIAGLYANRVNQSSIANQAAADFARSSGLVRQQQSSDAALRGLNTQLFMTEEQRNRLNAALAALSQTAGQQIDILGQQTQREIAGANIGLGRDELAERARSSNLNFELGQQDADMRLAEQNSLLNKILKGSQIVSNLAGAASGGLSAYSALTRPRGSA